MSELHKDDYGTILKALITDSCDDVQDVSSASEIYFYLGKPDNSVLTRSGVFTTDGTDGYIQYVTVSGDINTIGLWSLQGHVITPSGSYKSSITDFRVKRNLI